MKMFIRTRAWYHAWEENKDIYTMAELAEVFNTSLPTFFRTIRDITKVGSDKKDKKK